MAPMNSHELGSSRVEIRISPTNLRFPEFRRQSSESSESSRYPTRSNGSNEFPRTWLLSRRNSNFAHELEVSGIPTFTQRIQRNPANPRVTHEIQWLQ